MKLKNKLANEYAKEMGDRVYDYHAKLCFLAGFEKAREMILSEFPECKENDLYIEAPYSYFANLGEEEI